MGIRSVRTSQLASVKARADVATETTQWPEDLVVSRLDGDEMFGTCRRSLAELTPPSRASTAAPASTRSTLSDPWSPSSSQSAFSYGAPSPRLPCRGGWSEPIKLRAPSRQPLVHGWAVKPALPLSTVRLVSAPPSLFTTPRRSVQCPVFTV